MLIYSFPESLSRFYFVAVSAPKLTGGTPGLSLKIIGDFTKIAFEPDLNKYACCCEHRELGKAIPRLCLQIRPNWKTIRLNK